MARNPLTLTPPRHLRRGDVAGFGAGLLAYTLVLNYIRHGREGVTGWMSAKFLNKPMELDGTPQSSSRIEDDGTTVHSARLDTTRPVPAAIRTNT